MHDFDYQQCTKPAYPQKRSTCWCQKCKKKRINSNKSKILIGKCHQTWQTCIYSTRKKQIHLCHSVPHRVWNVCFCWCFWVYAGFLTFPYHFFKYMQVLCTFGIEMLIFFAGLVNLKSLKPTFLQPSLTQTIIFIAVILFVNVCFCITNLLGVSPHKITY